MTPKPPEGFDGWLGWCVQNAEYRDLWIERNCPGGDGQAHCMEDAARAELAALLARVAELEQQVAALARSLESLRNEDNCWCDGPEKDRRGETDITTHYIYCSEIRDALRAAGRKT